MLRMTPWLCIWDTVTEAHHWSRSCVGLDVHLLVVLFMAHVACDTCIYEPVF